MTDARFEDGAETPVRIRAETADDLPVIAALVQDAVLTAGEIAWMPRRHRVAVLLNRFRWEDRAAAEAQGRAYERVRAVLRVDGVLRVTSSGVDPLDRDLVLSLLTIDFAPAADGAGRLTLVLAGDGAIALDVECLDVSLTDVSRPYVAPSHKAPAHPID